jgi:hypothetical protein
MLHIDLGKYPPSAEHFPRLIKAFKSWGISKLFIDWGDTLNIRSNITRKKYYTTREVNKITTTIRKNNIHLIPIYHEHNYNDTISYIGESDGTHIDLNTYNIPEGVDKKGVIFKFINKLKKIAKQPITFWPNDFTEDNILDFTRDITILNMKEKIGKNIHEHILLDRIEDLNNSSKDLEYIEKKLRTTIWSLFLDPDDSINILKKISNMIYLAKHKICVVNNIFPLDEKKLGYNTAKGPYVSNKNIIEEKYHIEDNYIRYDNMYIEFDYPIKYGCYDRDKYIMVMSGDNLYKLSLDLQWVDCIYSGVPYVISICAHFDTIYILKHNILIISEPTNTTTINVPSPAMHICHNGIDIIYLVAQDNLYIYFLGELKTINVGGWCECESIVANRNIIYAQFKDGIYEYKCVEE